MERLVAVMIAVLMTSATAVAQATPVVLDADLEQAISEGFAEQASDPGKAGSTLKRGSLDVDVVVELVRTKVRAAGLRAATDALKKLTGDALRPWMHDLFEAVIAMARNRTRAVKIAGETALGIGARMILAEAVARTIEGRAELGGAPRVLVVDWVYWLLSREPLLAATTARPGCDGVADGAFCADYAELSDDEVVAELRRVTGLDQLFAALETVRKLAERVAGKPYGLRDILDGLKALPATLTAESFGISPTLLDDLDQAFNGLSALLALYDPIRLRWNELASALKGLRRDAEKFLADPAANMNAARQSLVHVRGLIKGEVSPGKDLLGAIDSVKARVPGLDRLAPAIDALRAVAAADPATITKDELMKLFAKHWPGALAELVDELELDDLRAAVDQALDIVQRVKTTAQDLANVSVEDAPELVARFAELDLDLQLLARVNERYRIQELVDRKLDAVAKGARELSDLARYIASIAVDAKAKLTAVVDSVKQLYKGATASPLITLLEPVIGDIVAAKKIDRAHLYRAFLEIDPKALLDAVGLPTEEVACAGDCAPNASCWGVRLVMLVHSAVAVEDGKFTIQTEAVVDDLVSLAGSNRQKVLRPYLHLAVGTGVMFDTVFDRHRLDEGLPLIAEQVGVGVKLAGNDKLALRAALFGSGLLYRFVLDSNESDGVMFGAAAIVDLYGEVELYASTTYLVAPGKTGEESPSEWYWTIGAQVPLADYLSQLAE